MQIIREWENLLNNHFTTIAKYLVKTKSLHKDYTKRNRNKSDIGFNVFKLSSDLYYREHFHSDIIKSFLDPYERHNEGHNYLHIFIDLLNSTNKEGNIEIIKHDFDNPIVEREKHGVDILITDQLSKKAIIIENKINNAGDQKRQLPRYYEIVKRNFTVVSIVYLTLNSSKRPDKFDWTKSELKKINSILKIIPAFDIDDSRSNLFSDWIVPSIINSTNIDSSFILRQYGSLIKYLNTNTMDTISLEKFYNTLQENSNMRTAISIRNMLNDLPEYLAIRIEDKYKDRCFPFKKVWRYKQRDTVFEAFEIDDLYLKLDVWCDENGYTVHLWEPHNPEYDITAELTSKFDFFEGFIIHSNEKFNVKKRFNIFEEDKLFNFIDNLLYELGEIKKSNNNIKKDIQ